jgi:hypothetical protein
VIYGSYDVTLYYVPEVTFNNIPTGPSFQWIGAMQECGWTFKPNAISVFSINGTRTARYIPYTKLMFDYRTVFYPHDIGLTSLAFLTTGSVAANSVTFEEAWKPLFSAPSDTRYVRLVGGKANKLRIKWKIGEPVQTEIDWNFASMPAGNPYTSTLPGSAYASEPTTNPYLFSDNSATIDGTQIFALDLDIDYDNKIQRDPHGYYIGGQSPRVLPAGRNPIKFNITTNWEDFNRLMDMLASSGQGTYHTVVFPYGPHTLTLGGTKWESLEVLKQVNKDIIAPKVPGIAETATLV